MSHTKNPQTQRHNLQPNHNKQIKPYSRKRLEGFGEDGECLPKNIQYKQHIYMKRYMYETKNMVGGARPVSLVSVCRDRNGACGMIGIRLRHAYDRRGISAHLPPRTSAGNNTPPPKHTRTGQTTRSGPVQKKWVWAKPISKNKHYINARAPARAPALILSIY